MSPATAPFPPGGAHTITMSKVAMMVSRNELDAPLARTFGKAKWLLLLDGDAGGDAGVEFRRNDMLSGGSVAGAIAAAGCREVIAAHMGEKAHDHLAALGIRVLEGPADVPVRSVIEMHRRGELRPWSPGPGTGSPGCSSADGARDTGCGRGMAPLRSTRSSICGGAGAATRPHSTTVG